MINKCNLNFYYFKIILMEFVPFLFKIHCKILMEFFSLLGRIYKILCKIDDPRISNIMEKEENNKNFSKIDRRISTKNI